MNDSSNTEYVAPLSGFISRIANLIAPAEAKAAPPTLAPVPTREVLTEIRAGQLTGAHVGRTISLRDGGRGKIIRIDRRADAQTGRSVTDVATAQGGLRSYGAETVLLLAEMRPQPILRAATEGHRNIDGQTTAEFLASKAAAGEAKAAEAAARGAEARASMARVTANFGRMAAADRTASHPAIRLEGTCEWVPEPVRATDERAAEAHIPAKQPTQLRGLFAGLTV